MSARLKIATRGSELALWQARRVASGLALDAEIVVVETEGDRSLDKDLTQIGGQGVFVKEVQQRLLDGDADLAVHSAKDLPSVSIPGLRVGAWLVRADPRDVIVGCTLATLPKGARVGTSSVRRAAQLRSLRPDVQIVALRGNIRTRLTKGEDLDAIFVAAAALERLELEPTVKEALSPELMMPQVGQGAIAVECRADRSELVELLQSVNDETTELTVTCERSFLASFGTGCSLPIGALAEYSEGILTLRGMVASHDGTRVLRGSLKGVAPEDVGAALAASFVDRGALALLDSVERSQ